MYTVRKYVSVCNAALAYVFTFVLGKAERASLDQRDFQCSVSKLSLTLATFFYF